MLTTGVLSVLAFSLVVGASGMEMAYSVRKQCLRLTPYPLIHVVMLEMTVQERSTGCILAATVPDIATLEPWDIRSRCDGALDREAENAHDD